MKRITFKRLALKLVVGAVLALGLRLAAAQGVGVLEETDEYRLVRHAAGETQVPLNPQRVVALQSSIVDSVVALGVMPVAATLDEGPEEGFVPELAEKIETVPDVGWYNEPNLEAVVAADPDLIISWRYEGEGPSYEQLSKIAPTVVLEFPWADYRQELLDIGAVLGLEEEAEARLAEFDALLQEARAQLDEAIGDETVAFLRLRENGLVLYGGFSPAGKLLYDDLGLRSPALVPTESFSETLSLEVLPQLEADRLFITEEDAERVSAVQGSTLWQSIPAVREGNVYPVKVSYWIGSGVINQTHLVNEVVRLLGRG